MSDLLPELTDWYRDTKDSQFKRDRLADHVRRYNLAIERFNNETGYTYSAMTTVSLRSWLYTDKRLALPHLDEILVLGVVLGVRPRSVITRYRKAVDRQFSTSLGVLQ